jgi:hypothetical protein
MVAVLLDGPRHRPSGDHVPGDHVPGDDPA